MSTPMNDDQLVSLVATLLQPHFEDLGLNSQELLLKREKMIAIIARRLSLSYHEEVLTVGVESAVENSGPANLGNPNYAPAGGLVDAAFYKRFVAQATVANNKSFTKLVHGYLVDAGKEKEAETYLEKVSPDSLVQNLESMKLWNYQTLPFKVLKGLEEIGLGENPLGAGPPPHHFPVPEPNW